MHFNCLGIFERYLRVILNGKISEENWIHKISNHLIKRLDDLVELFCIFQMISANKDNHKRSWVAGKQPIIGQFICILDIISKDVFSEGDYNDFLYFFVVVRLYFQVLKKQMVS
jgi:hypothetical protein